MKPNQKISTILVCLLLCSFSLFSQSQSMGNLFLSTTDYAQLPRPNWDTLKRYSTKNTIGSNSAYG